VTEPSKKLLAMVRPAKPISQMTDAERRAFAREVAILAESRVGQPPRPSKSS
jgi:hypothetical protein